VNNPNTITQLISKPDIDVNKKITTKFAPLHFAIKHQNIGAAKQLLKKKDINTDIQGPTGLTPLHIVCQKGNNTLIGILIDKNADLLILNNMQSTPLACAFIAGKIDTIDKHYVKLMIHAQDATNNTQLHKCATIKCIQQLKKYLTFLLSNGVNIWSKNNNGFTAFDLAYKKYRFLCHHYIANVNSGVHVIFDTEQTLRQLNDQAEVALHFWAVTNAKMEYILLKEVFTTYKNNFQCQDIIPTIMLFYSSIDKKIVKFISKYLLNK